MNRLLYTRTPRIAFFVLAAAVLTIAQAPQRNFVDERNVRAQMTFLAGDAMQGRGSGTQFEWIAAEYVASQFMQFGLEPAGDAGWDGKPGFVQAVTITRNVFSERPTLTHGSAKLTHGNEFVTIRANAERVSGPLQKISAGQTPAKGAAVLLSFGVTPTTAAGINQAMQAALSAGAAIVIVEETPQLRANWENWASRRLGFTTSNAAPGAALVASRETAAAIAALPDGERLEFAGQLGPPQVIRTWNAIGKLTGSDPKLRSEVIVLSSHLDHVGVRENAAGGDKIFNGADDDASGTVAVMEIARALSIGKRTRRTVYFVCFGSEEAGGHGSNHFADNLPFPQAQFVANLQFEMIGRPDAKVRPEELWLTGFERSNLGPELAKRGSKLVADPHPQENFFQRSDNYTLARRGIIAHTVSSFGLHADYHRASDELDTIDFVHMTRAINSMIGPVRWLADSGFRPAWNPGMKP